jgi:hypothetical protein
MTPDRVRRLANCTLSEHRAARRYRVPCEAASDLDDARLVHADLPHLDDAALLVESARVVGALAEGDVSAHERQWLEERLAQISAEGVTENRRFRRRSRASA